MQSRHDVPKGTTMLPVSSAVISRFQFSRYTLPWGSDYVFVSQALTKYVRRQKVPFNLDLPYKRIMFRTIHPPDDADAWAVYPDSFPDMVRATNTARRRFVERLGQSSQLGSTLTAELRSSWGVVSGGIASALLAARAAVKGNIPMVAHHLGFHPPVVRQRVRVRYKGSSRKRTVYRDAWRMPDGREVAKSLSNKWLFYSYGVAPLMGDLQNAMEVLTRLPPLALIWGTGSSVSTYRIAGPSQTRYEVGASVRISARVRVKNPNLWLANQLGLINPVQMVNEGIRLSFVVDWFSNLSQVISQMTDFVGLEVTRPITFSKSKIQQYSIWTGYNLPLGKERQDIERRLEIPDAVLVIEYERPNWQRGLNAISLLLQILKTGKK